MARSQTGLADINGAKLYYEVAGEGQPLVMIHAGVADNRQWNNDFAYYAARYKVIRYDQRGYGQSARIAGQYAHLSDLVALLAYLDITEPLILMGCSMGGQLSMDFALEYPARARALIMVDSGPGGLDLDVPALPKFADVEKAYDAGDWDLLAELETQIWFDGEGRSPDQVDSAARQLAYSMNRNALNYELEGLGELVPNIQPPAAERLDELALPVLVILGLHDTPYMHAAAQHMITHIPTARLVTMEDAAHLPNMEHPAEFHRLVDAFLAEVTA